MALLIPTVDADIRLCFDLPVDQVRRLRQSQALRAITIGRVQSRPAAIGAGFRSLRHVSPDPETKIDMLLSLEPGDPGAGGLIGRLRLTLIEGEFAALSAFVLRLHATTPLRLSVWHEQARVQPCAAEEIDPDVPAEGALAVTLRGCQTHLLRLLGEAVENSEVEAVHQVRVGLRRLRAAIGLFRPLLPVELATQLNSEARWLGSVLAPVRDWDVYLGESLAPFHAKLPDDVGLRELERRAGEARAVAAGEMHAALQSARCLAFFMDVEAAIESRAWRRQPVSESIAHLFAPLRETAPILLDRLWRSVRKQALALPTGGAAASHELRKKIKKLRYSIEFVQCIGSKKDVKNYLGELSQLQHRLGAANDAAMAEGLTTQLLKSGRSPELARIGGFIAGWVARTSEMTPTDAAEGWRRLRATDKFWRGEKAGD